VFKKCLHWKESKKERKQERICRRIPEKTKDDFEEFFFLKKIPEEKPVLEGNT
jgi:hypothetical protein